MRGRKPKDEARKAGHAEVAHGWIEVENLPYRGGRPHLPKETSDATRAWWRAVSTMPHCILWAPGDWQFALDTALVHSAVAGGQLRFAGELRQREKILGLTVEARRDLRIRYVEVAPVAAPQAKPMNEQDAERWRAIINADD